MGTTTKRIKITENQLSMLVNELMKVGDTPREQFLNYLDKIGKPGRLTGTGNIEELYQNAIQGGLSNFIKRNTDDPKVTYTKEDIEDLETEFYDEHGEILQKISVDKARNLIYVYRGLSLPKQIDNYYEELTKYFDGLGLPWGVDYEAAIPYGGDLSGDIVTLCGKVSPDSIDWEYTISIAADVKENELRLLKNKPVEIYKIVTSIGVSLPLKKPIIVSTGNSTKWD